MLQDDQSPSLDRSAAPDQRPPPTFISTKPVPGAAPLEVPVT